jgi:Protein of unknown function (DUF2786)
MMQKILALLAKAESTEFEGEAAVYLAKAEKLMVRHSIDQADLKPEEREKIIMTRVTITRNRPDHVLWNSACLANDVKFIRNPDNTFATLVGFPADIAFVQALYASLLLQREGFLRRETKPHWENGRTFNHSFRLGYANRIYQRLTEAKKVVVEKTGPGTELVLASKAAQVDLRTKQEFPRVVSGSRIRAHSRAAYTAGAAAANRADASGGRNNLGTARGVLA